jgi:transcription initiation factor TFIIIB Brf1 subunit/transcription initiation factor TFIIB
MECYFDTLDSLTTEDKKQSHKCCDLLENMVICEESTTCRSCGQEINNISSCPEKMYAGKNTCRTGMAASELLPDSTCGSVISQSYISNPNMRMISRLNMYNGIPYKTRSLLIVFNNISEKCLRHNISKKIINESQGLYKIISKYKISRGSNRSGIISACIFMACKNCDSARSSSEIAKIMEIEKKIVTKGIKQLQDIIRVNKIPLERVVLARVTPLDLIDRICNSINEISVEEINDIKLLCVYFNENHNDILSSCTPPSLAAALVNYYVLTNKLNVDKNKISDESNVSIVTIHKITNILLSII